MPVKKNVPVVPSREGIPPPTLEHRSRDYAHRPCPECRKSCYRNTRSRRRLHDIGDLKSGRPHEIEVVMSQHRCHPCGIYFNASTQDLAPAGSHYTHRVISLAVQLVVEDGLPYQAASWNLWRDHRVFVPFATIQNWVEAAGKKKSP